MYVLEIDTGSEHCLVDNKSLLWTRCSLKERERSKRDELQSQREIDCRR